MKNVVLPRRAGILIDKSKGMSENKATRVSIAEIVKAGEWNVDSDEIPPRELSEEEVG